MFEVTRYEDEGDRCVLKPLSNMNRRDRVVWLLKSERIAIATGTQVIYVKI